MIVAKQSALETLVQEHFARKVQNDLAQKDQWSHFERLEAEANRKGQKQTDVGALF